MKKCIRGHDMTDANVYVIPSTGKTLCRTCRAMGGAALKRANRMRAKFERENAEEVEEKPREGVISFRGVSLARMSWDKGSKAQYR